MVGPFGFHRATRKGWPILKEDVRWWKLWQIAGFFVNTNKGCYWFYIRPTV